MKNRSLRLLPNITKRMLPFADAASSDFPLGQLLRLSLFQISVGMASVMLLGTLNRVMIVELSVPALIVASMIALPVLIAPLGSLGFRSDNYRSAIGWKRVPYLWFGSLWQMGGLAIMPFSLMVLSGDQTLGPSWAGEVLAALAFIMTGIGLHMTETAGLALARDRASDENRPRVVAVLYDVSCWHGYIRTDYRLVATRFHKFITDTGCPRCRNSRTSPKSYSALEAGKY